MGRIFFLIGQLPVFTNIRALNNLKLARCNWKFQLHPSLLVSCLLIAAVPLHLLALSPSFHVTLSPAPSVSQALRFPTALSLALPSLPVSVSSIFTTFHLSPFLRLSPTVSPALLSSLPPSHPACSTQICTALVPNNSGLSNIEEDICILPE